MKKYIENIIINSKYLLVPFYFGLIVAQGLYCIKFCETLWEAFIGFHHMSETDFMLMVLTLIDIAMIANLIKMIITGSYQTFVDKINGDHSEKVGSGLLKVKMGSSLVGVSSIHLLQTFINSANHTDRDIIIRCSIHVIFLISTVGLAYIDYLHHLTLDEKEAH